jgi:hypothetical protein
MMKKKKIKKKKIEKKNKVAPSWVHSSRLLLQDSSPNSYLSVPRDHGRGLNLAATR